jgi:uncharacterized protein with ParB-like and HNH nuclease domain
MIDIQPRYITLSRLLRGRLFRIPQYQRTYSWQSKHRKDLFEDIQRTWVKGSERLHCCSGRNRSGRISEVD